MLNGGAPRGAGPATALAALRAVVDALPMGELPEAIGALEAITARAWARPSS